MLRPFRTALFRRVGVVEAEAHDLARIGQGVQQPAFGKRPVHGRRRAGQAACQAVIEPAGDHLRLAADARVNLADGGTTVGRVYGGLDFHFTEKLGVVTRVGAGPGGRSDGCRL